MLFVVAVLGRLTYALLMHPAELSWADETSYDTIAWRLATTGQYESRPYLAAPGWPALLAAIYVVAGHSFTAVRVVQAVLGGVLVVAIAATGKLLFGSRTGLIAGAVTAAYAPLVYLGATLYADHAGAVLLASSVWSLVAWQRTPTRMGVVRSALLLGATALTRPVFLLILPIAAMYVLWHAPGGQRVRQVVLLTLVTAAVILPWSLRNVRAYGHFVPVSVGFGHHLWAGNNEVSRGNSDDRHLVPLGPMWQRHILLVPDTERAAIEAKVRQLALELAQMDGVEFDKRLQAEALAWIRTHPRSAATLAARKLRTLYSPFSRIDSDQKIDNPRTVLIATLFLLPILALGIPGAVLAVRRNRAAWLVPAIIVMVTLAYTALTASTRYRMPIDMLWILLASVTANVLLERLRRPATEHVVLRAER